MVADVKHDAEILLRAENLTVLFSGRRVLNEVSLVVKKGERIALLGPSGCGKSTLLNVLSGLLTPNKGLIERFFLPSETAIVFQDSSLLPWKTVEDNVCVLPKLMAHHQKLSVTQERVKNILDLVGLWERRGAYPDELSGGMRMRVSIARALLMSPSLLFLDEPFSALDDLTRERLQDDLLRIQTINKNSYIIVTHNVEEAAILSERILLFSEYGKICAEFKTADFASGTPFVRDSAGIAELRIKVREAWKMSHGGGFSA